MTERTSLGRGRSDDVDDPSKSPLKSFSSPGDEIVLLETLTGKVEVSVVPPVSKFLSRPNRNF